MLLQVKPTQLDKLPRNWENASNWPGPGVYWIETGAEKDNLFVVDQWSVTCHYDIVRALTFIDEDFIDDEEEFTASSADLAHMVIEGAKFNPKGN